MLSRRAANAMNGLDLRRALRQVALAADAPADKSGGTPVAEPADTTSTRPLSADEAARLAVLLSQRAALPFCEVARVPLHLLPPPTVEPVNPLQRLQVLLTRQFATPGWSARLRALADQLPADARGRADAALRHDFNLFVGALAPPRLLGVGEGADGHVPDSALADAWADERVQRRWQRFAAALGEVRTVAMLGHAISAPPDDVGRTRLATGRPGSSRGLALRRPALGAKVPHKVSCSSGEAAHAFAR